MAIGGGVPSLPCLALLLLLVSWNVGLLAIAGGLPPCEFPAIYNFGDSNSDTGGISAAFYPMGSPTGETFFHRPEGRASDGRLIIDFIAEHLGLPYLSAYLDSLGWSFRHGANFATGGSTIRRQNESFFENGVSPFSLDIQTAHYDQFVARTSYLFKNARAEKFPRSRLPMPEDFSKALYVFDIGQNDLAAGFRKMTNEQLNASMPDIVSQLATAVQHLYQQGARTFWIHNTGPIGCLPITLRYIRNPMPGYLDEIGCVKDQNEMASEFNRQLKEMVMQLRGELPEAALTYVDVYTAKYSLIANSTRAGFERAGKMCCGYEWEDKHVWCGQKASINGSEVVAGSCEDPSIFVSWDGVHYTEAANRWISEHIISGLLSDRPNVPITHACYRL